jgi:hypothetical protein
MIVPGYRCQIEAELASKFLRQATHDEIACFLEVRSQVGGLGGE